MTRFDAAISDFRIQQERLSGALADMTGALAGVSASLPGVVAPSLLRRIEALIREERETALRLQGINQKLAAEVYGAIYPDDAGH
ncbi:MAG: hypothetical protein F9K29_23790 [Hyphomicrobiaceae bacterium]|nr:MAG: hypothetical protein F9K29_23790 [Hyphomicrobiaceae bacterium]